VVNTTLATGLGIGAVAAYNIAFTVLQIPLGLVGFPLGVVLLPAMSRALAAGDQEEFAALLGQTMRLLLWSTLFLSFAGIALRTPTIDLLFAGGFSEPDLALAAATLGVFLLGLPAHALNVVLARAFYSAQDTRTPVTIALLSVGVNVAVSVLTVGALGLSGLALGIALGGWIEALLLALLLRRRWSGLAFGSVARSGLMAVPGAVLAGLTAALALMALGDRPGRAGALLLLVVGGGAAMAVYLLYSRLMGLPELRRTLGLLRSALHRG
jgi:putative peptidoglycan lipid II flippase